MHKEKYVSTELEILRFQTEDVILTSGESNPGDGGNETPNMEP